jgi:hypothetical protein
MTYFRFPTKDNEKYDGLDLSKLRVIDNLVLDTSSISPPERIVHLKDFPKFDEADGRWKV